MTRLLITVASILALLNIGVCIPLSCPTAETLNPCTCKRLAYGLRIVCTNLKDTATLTKALKYLHDYKVQIVLLHDLMLEEVLPNDLFDGLDISELRIEKSKLKFPLPAFTGLQETLLTLRIAQHTVIRSPEDFSLAQLNKLTELTISANRLGTVKDEWLNGKIPNVRILRLDQDEITLLESKAFANLHYLESISIAGNRIRDIERNMFPNPTTALKKIDLSGNEIASLPKDLFWGMPEIEVVILSGNELTTLPEITWGGVWQKLNVVLLFQNNLVCDSNMNWLKKFKWPKQVEGICVAPSYLIAKSIQDVYKS